MFNLSTYINRGQSTTQMQVSCYAVLSGALGSFWLSQMALHEQ